MPTNEERREVAEEIRQMMLDGYNFTATNTAEVIGVYESDYDDPYLFDNDCWQRLADLIEPEPERTCEILHDDNLSEQYGGPMARCSYCWAALPEEFIGPYYYCPCCGSKNKVAE